MDPLLNRNVYFVKEHVGMFKAANEYDILDPETREKLLECREPELGTFTKILRFTDYKRMTPFKIVVRTPSNRVLLTVKRKATMFVSKVAVEDGNGRHLGGFQQKFFSIGGKFDVLDAEGRVVCALQGKWSSFEFSFKAGNDELARVTKKWGGFGKELFTSADDYVLEIAPRVPADHPARQLILAAVLVIDMVLKE